MSNAQHRLNANDKAVALAKILKIWNEEPDVRITHLVVRFGIRASTIREHLALAKKIGLTTRELEQKRGPLSGTRKLDRI